MKIGLLGTGKLGFIDGKSSKVKFNAALQDLWEKCNVIVLSWIMISFSRELLSCIVYARSKEGYVMNQCKYALELISEMGSSGAKPVHILLDPNTRLIFFGV